MDNSDETSESSVELEANPLLTLRQARRMFVNLVEQQEERIHSSSSRSVENAIIASVLNALSESTVEVANMNVL